MQASYNTTSKDITKTWSIRSYIRREICNFRRCTVRFRTHPVHWTLILQAFRRETRCVYCACMFQSKV